MKHELRLRARAIAQHINQDWHTEVSASVCSRLYSYLQEFDYQSIGLYMPMRDEVDVRPLISKLQKEGKSVYLPKVINRSDIAFFHYEEGDTLERNGVFSLEEPSADKKAIETALDILIVPAVHFYCGYRLGQGKGYYDRYLSKYPPKHLLAGITLGLLGNEPFPQDEWDIPMKIIFSPKDDDSSLPPLLKQNA